VQLVQEIHNNNNNNNNINHSHNNNIYGAVTQIEVIEFELKSPSFLLFCFFSDDTTTTSPNIATLITEPESKTPAQRETSLPAGIVVWIICNIQKI